MEAHAADSTVRLMTLDPGHFHAALVQKSMYPQADPVVHVYAPQGPDLELHLKRIEAFNTRPTDPTRWQTTVHAGADFLERMLDEKPGNVVVISGNNARKTEYILHCVDNGLHVLADKPMVIQPADYARLQQAFAQAKNRGVLLYDIMTERHEITTILQRELSQMKGLFGKLEQGTADRPAVTKESVHHYFKHVSGKPLIRPPWFFDVTQQGEGIVDVTTHLVDLIQWGCFPERPLRIADVEVLSARRWTTRISPAQFRQVTGLDVFPEYLKPAVNASGDLEVYGNGEFTYKLRGVSCKVSVTWNFQAPDGAGDTHYSIMRGSKVNLVIKQGAEQKFQPTLFIQPVTLKGTALDREVAKAVAVLQEKYPGVAVRAVPDGLELVVPASFKLGHEAHFAQVTEAYLSYLKAGQLPEWEVPNMLVKYHTIMRAYEMSR
jgi:predicted dehydrogenase